MRVVVSLPTLRQRRCSLLSGFDSFYQDERPDEELSTPKFEAIVITRLICERNRITQALAKKVHLL